MHGARALDHGGNLDFGNSAPSAKMFLKKVPDDILADATSGGGRDHDPGGLVPATFDGFAQNDGRGAPPVAMKRVVSMFKRSPIVCGPPGRPCLVGKSRRGTTLNSSVVR